MSDIVDDKVSEDKAPGQESDTVQSSSAVPAPDDSGPSNEGGEGEIKSDEKVPETERDGLSSEEQENVEEKEDKQEPTKEEALEAEKQAPTKEEGSSSGPGDDAPIGDMDEAKPDEASSSEQVQKDASTPSTDSAEGPPATKENADSSQPDQAPATTEVNKEGSAVSSPQVNEDTRKKIDIEKEDIENQINSSPQEQVSEENEQVPTEEKAGTTSLDEETSVKFCPSDETIPVADDAPVDEVTDPLEQISEPSPEKEQPMESDQPGDGLPLSPEIESPMQPTASAVATASPNDACKDSKDQCFHHPLSLHWSFGYNSKLPVHNISEGNRKMIFYACAHTGVLLDCTTNQQCLLQGHSNPISCIAVSADRRWLATADKGKECVLIVWDSFSGIPVRTYFNGIGEGTIAIAISPDSQFIATISASQSQVVSIWEWTTLSDTPITQAYLGDDYSYQTYLTFHHEDSHQLISNSEDLVVFYSWKEKELKFHAHPVLDKDFNRNIGRFYQSVFVPKTTLGLSGTSEGHCVVWQNEGSDDEPHVKRGVKLMRLHECAITVMTSTTEMVVTGDAEGKIKFFDHELKMLNWYEDTMQYGPLRSISFSYSPNLALLKSRMSMGIQTHKLLGDHSYPLESTKHAFPFIVPDYTISTATACIVYYTASGSAPEVILSEHDAAVNALAAHPFLPRLLTSGYACKMKLWDYDTKLVLATRHFGDQNYVRCVDFDPKGEFISVGFVNGTLLVVDALTLMDVLEQPFQFSRDAITHIAFSHDSAYMATADLDKCVCVYVANPDDEQKPWKFLAKYRSHFKKIESLMFGVKLDSDSPRLLSLGRDRSLVEYDLANSSTDNLVLMSSVRVEQSAIPLAMTWYPPLTTESFILLVNNQYKVKLYNSTTKMCRQTLLGPIYGSPLRKIIVLPAPIVRDADKQEVRRYLAYCTNNKVGLLLLPHDGNPHNSKCLVAHPGKVAEMTCSFDGKYVFTAGGADCGVNMWCVNTEALEAASLLGGEDLQPFYAMLDGGRDGEFFNELEEYFYYAQIRSQGPELTTTREVSTTIPIEEIPYVMRAIGFYPSEQEIEDMMNEVKFSEFVTSHSYVTEVDLGTLLKLYINHRPVFGLSPLQVGQAFKILGSKQKDEKHWCVDRSTLLTLLQEGGEHMTEQEIVEYLMTLLGFSDNPEVDGSFTEDVVTALEEIPERISAPMFAEEIIGLSTQND